MTVSPKKPSRDAGLSLPELLICVAVIGLLSAMALPHLTHTGRAATAEVAQQKASCINRALAGYRQCAVEITIAADGQSSRDESAVMALLTTRDDGVVGSPLLTGVWPAASTNNPLTYRVEWNGHSFVVLDPGTPGLGLLIPDL